jgi:hypothetical protein
MGTVRVEIGVGVAMVRPMAAGPPFDGALDGAGAGEGEKVLERLGSIVRAVRPETMVASGYAWRSVSGEAIRLNCSTERTYRGL